MTRDWDELEERIAGAEWVEGLDPVNMSAVDAGIRRTRRVRLGFGICVCALSVAVPVPVIYAFVTGDASSTAGPAAASATAVPWTAVAPSKESAETETATDCLPSQIELSAGQSGAYQGMTSQQVRMVNASSESCSLRGDFVAQFATDEGTQVPADMSAIREFAEQLGAGSSAHLMFGATAACGSQPGERIAHNVTVTYASGAPTSLSGVWMSVGCHTPRAISLEVDPVEPATNGLPLRATIADVGPARPGEVLAYTVTLTNDGDKAIIFDDCPTYSEDMKEPGHTETYVLNCAEGGSVPANGSVTYDMRITVPGDASGSVWLSWQLHGYAATDGLAITVK